MISNIEEQWWLSSLKTGSNVYSCTSNRVVASNYQITKPVLIPLRVQRMAKKRAEEWRKEGVQRNVVRLSE